MSKLNNIIRLSNFTTLMTLLLYKDVDSIKSMFFHCSYILFGHRHKNIETFIDAINVELKCYCNVKLHDKYLSCYVEFFDDNDIYNKKCIVKFKKSNSIKSIKFVD